MLAELKFCGPILDLDCFGIEIEVRTQRRRHPVVGDRSEIERCAVSIVSEPSDARQVSRIPRQALVVDQRYFERVSRFVDFGIKLAVIEELMYTEAPKLALWSLEDTLRARGFDGDWDGEGDQFDIAGLDDLHLLPNLKRVISADRLAPQLQDLLRSRGIELID
ncbi:MULTISPECIES: DUF6892 domain-containing protein [Nocardia]|uniref:DUF6892 domain-containing protein n=1 Tax=Nocardia TaxID=1817 RepID=UPI000D690D7E|nr:MULTISPECIES: hypothetical protein [Nocardia]